MGHAHVYVVYLTSGGKDKQQKNQNKFGLCFRDVRTFSATHTVMYKRAV